MPSRPTNIFILVEDAAQQRLVRRFLQRCEHKAPRFEPLPNGHGCGSQYVREHLPRLLAKLKSALGHRVQSIAIVMVDADQLTVQARRQELRTNGLEDSVALLIPKKHVETWVGALNGKDVNEHDSYDQLYGSPQLAKMAADQLREMTRANYVPPTDLLPSLAASLPEWRKI